ncbi:golgin subfamily A member 6-like protein 1 [Triticum aestivum]|uniref:golgin subfamily A member 6-like protein 1 n=1 Tax=Triticum aestivum TaxID=4565 RepID=UPI001D030BEE|nr:golgin subfamily A member 6-like protein 1 [Triticum aestivum]
MMRFLNKAKLVELAKFNDFKLLGTGMVIKVQPWSLDHQVVGKMHTIWVRLAKVPDCFRHFLGVCEVAIAVGPVLEIDMDTINEEKIRAKCGIRDVEKIPTQVEITSPDLLMFRIGMETEKVVGIGWYKEEKRKNDSSNFSEGGEDEIDNRKRTRMEENEHRGVSLGCLSLKQSEEVDKRIEGMKTQMDVTMLQWQKEMALERGKWQKESEIMFSKIKTLEEDKIRNNALWAKNENRIRELEKVQAELREISKKQLEEIQKLTQEAANREEYEMELANMDLEDYEKETQQKKEDTESGKYNEPTDYNASQESIGTLGEKMAKIHGSEILDKEGEEKDVEIKRSLRNKGREDKKIEDMAKSRAEERDNYGNSWNHMGATM